MRNFIINTRWINWLITFAVFYVVTGFMQGDPRPGIVCAFIVFWYFNPKEQETGVFSIRSNHYGYIIADRTHLGLPKGNGILVALPSYVPHIFIDQHSNDKKIGFMRNFKNLFPQKLESTFGTRTTIYAKKEERLEVLTILNPSTMEAIQEYAMDFDVEFVNKSLILWSHKKIVRRPELKNDAIIAAQKIAESLNQTLSRYAHKEMYFDRLETRESDRLLKLGNIRIGSIRRIISVTLSSVITTYYVLILINSFKQDAQQQTGSTTIKVIATIIWLFTVGSILYIGFTRKKIDISL